MSAKKPSRRQLLGGILAALLAWLGLRPARASGQARLRGRRRVLVALARPRCFSSVTIYDAAGRGRKGTVIGRPCITGSYG